MTSAAVRPWMAKCSFEVVRAQGPAFFQPLVVQRETLDQQLGQAGGGPLAERSSAGGADPVANGQDHVEVVVVDGPFDFAVALGLNYPETPDSCRRVEFSLTVDVDQVLIGSLDRDLEQLGDKALRKPNAATLQANLELGGPVPGK